MKRAISDVDDGLSIRSSAKLHGIPASTLRGHLYGITTQRKRGKKSILSDKEEQKLVEYLLGIQNLGYPLTIGQLREKVGILTQRRFTPFIDVVLGVGWIKCFKNRHSELCIRKAQALDQKRAKHLCPKNVNSFYENLKELYDMYNYQTNHVWNCDETGVQAGKDGGGFVIAKRGCKNVHIVTPDQREWLSILVCINAAEQAIPNFYIFKGKRKTRNFLRKTGDVEDVMAMQEKAWMTSSLFRAWMNHFLRILSKSLGLDSSNRHLLIMDRHKSHVSFEVITVAKAKGLDLLTFPSHTFHALQPLDVTCFKPFK